MKERLEQLEQELKKLKVHVYMFEEGHVWFVNKGPDLIATIDDRGSNTYTIQNHYDPAEYISKGILTKKDHLKLQEIFLEWNLDKPVNEDTKVQITYDSKVLEVVPHSKKDETIDKIKESIKWEFLR